MEGFMGLINNVSSDITVCLRGRHAVGKSEGVYQAAAGLRSELYKDADYCKQMVSAMGGKLRCAVDGTITHVKEWSYDHGLPVIERRLSQMTEGDIIGLPEIKDISFNEHSWRSTAFRPCDWLILSCHFPSMLFLDERNRALPGVKQAVFQLADSKAFYGHILHPETHICVAENVGMSYQVEQSDPAEISRWVTVELDPSVEEWFAWADGKVHLALVEFLRANPKLLEYKGTFEAEKKYPDRRSWYKLDQELQRLGIYEDDNPNKDNRLYYMAGAFVGAEAGPKFTKFVQAREKEIKATDILDSWAKCKKKLSKGQKHGISNAQFLECVGKLGDWIKVETNLLNDHQAREYARFMQDAPPEARMTTWGFLSESPANVIAVHPYAQHLIVLTANGESTSNVKIPTTAPKSPKKTRKATTRGHKKEA